MLDGDDHRRRMIAETSAFIEWGLANPDKVRRIPRKRVGEGGFSREMSCAFWFSVLGTVTPAPRELLGRFLRWVHLA